MTVTIEGEKQRVTVQQALLLRPRDQAVRGGVWAGKLVQKVIDAFPDGPGEYDHIDFEVGLCNLGRYFSTVDLAISIPNF